MDLKFVLLIATLVSAISAGPTGYRNSECATECTSTGKFFYETGREYEYDYEAETRTNIPGVSSDDAVLKVSARAIIQTVNDCEFILSLRDVKLHDSAKSAAFAEEVTRRSMRFALQDGKIEHVCSSEKEDKWIVNFKKGILSTFQNSMNNIGQDEVLTETDISGTCETSYTSTTQNSETIVTKTKSPSKCSHQPKIQQSFSTFGYSLDSLVQGLPVMNSEQECKQYISEKLIQRVQCEEKHVFVPFERQATGAQTSTRTSLKLVNVGLNSNSHFESFITRSEPLFDIPTEEENSSFLEATEAILTELESLTQKGIKKEVPATFSNLVTSLRALSHTQIEKLFDDSPLRIKRFIIDALPLVNTAEAMSTFVHLIIRGELTEEEASVWYTSLAFIKNPTLEMFEALQPLLREVSENKAILGVSSLINNYCLKNSECQEKSSIQTLLREMESRLGSGCRATSEEEKINILFALKALGNAGRFVNANTVLKRCYLEDNSMEVRVAAIDAWRHTPCDYDRSHILSTYIDGTQENEIRIASYLALMKCPTQELIDNLRDRLMSESVNQVESFVWTHLTNLQESAAHEKQWIRHLIGEELLQKKFNTESLKLSRNYESSFYLKEQEFGASVDSNMIFSGKSFLPRSSMVNFTIDLFGESINLFEVGGRMEGFEAYIERFFGPDGYYPEETVEAIIKNFRQDSPKEETSLKAILAKDDNEPKGSFYLKLFGNEIFYRNFNGVQSIFQDMKISNIFDIMMELASKGNVDFTKTYDLVNSEFTFPTITGFPITLNMKGFATVGLKLDGNFKFENLRAIDIQGILHPSAAVNFDALMLVDAFVTKSGMKFTSSMHSSTSVEGKAIIKDGQLVDMTIDVPEEKIEIFDMKNEFIRIEDGNEEKETTEGQSYERCIPVICKYLGMDLCYKSISSSASLTPRFPLSGPFEMEIALSKTDSHSSYTFHYSNNPTKTLIMLDMPESQADKKWSAEISKENQKYEIVLQSPHGSSNGKVSYLLGTGEVKLESELVVNDRKMFVANFQVARTLEKKHNQMKAILYLESPFLNGKVIDISGEYDFDQVTKSLDAKISFEGSSYPSFKANFNVKRGTSQNSLTFGIESTPFDMSMSGVVGQLTSEGELKFKGHYRLFDNPLRSLTSLVKYQKQSNDVGVSYSTSAEIQELDFKTDAKIYFSGTTFNAKLAGKLSEITWDLESISSYVKTDKATVMKISQNFDIPRFGIDFTLDKHVGLFDDQFLMEKSLKMGDLKSESKISWIFGEKLSADIKTDSDGSSIDLQLKINKKSEGSYNLTFGSNVNGITRDLEGSLDSSIKMGKMDTTLGGQFTTVSDDEKSRVYDFFWTLKATEEELNSETKLNCDGRNCFFNLKVTKSSLDISSTFVKPFTAQVKFEKTREGNRFLITSRLDEITFLTSASLTPTSMQGSIKYKENDMKLEVKLLERGAELELRLSPSKIFKAFVSYNLEPVMSLDLGLETPFQGFEKQDASFSLNQADGIQGQASITFQNIHHITLNFEMKDQSSPTKVNYFGNCVFSSTFGSLNRFEIVVNHSASQKTINSIIDGKYNSEIIKGNFASYPTEEGYKINMNFKTPFTEDTSVLFDHKMTNSEIVSSFDVAYGSLEKLRILLKGNLIDKKNMNGIFICSSSFLPEININAVMQTTSSKKNIEIKGKYNDNKVIFLFNCEKYMNNQDHICKMDTKLVTASSKLFSMSFNKKIGLKKDFEIDVEFSSSLISEKTLKGHIEGKLSLSESATIAGYISGPSISGKINLKQEITNKTLQTNVQIEFNSFTAGLSFGGNIDRETKEASLHGEIESSSTFLDGFKMTLQHNIEGQARETLVTLSKKDYNMKLYHSIFFRNMLEWSNIIKINNMYSITSKMTSSDGSLKHVSKFELGEKPRASTETTWTTLMKLTILHETEGTSKKSQIKIDYGNGKSLLIKSEYEFKINSKSVKLFILNEDWNIKPLEGEINVKNNVRKSVDMSIRLNEVLTAVFQLFKEKETTGVNMKIKFNREDDIPISLIVKYSSSTLNVRKSFIEFIANKMYSVEFTSSHSLNEQSGEISSKINIPLFFNEHVESKLTYNFKQNPVHITMTNTYENKQYQLEAQVGDKQIMIETICPSGNGSLNVKWDLNEIKKGFMLDFKSPFKFVKDTNLVMKYDEDIFKLVNVEFTYDIHQIGIKGKLNNELINFECNTTFSDYKKLEMQMEWRGYDMKGILSRDSDIVRFSGNFEFNRGEGEITYNLPALGFENNSASIKYNINIGKGNINLETKVGHYFKFQIQSAFAKFNPKTIMLDIESAWENLDKVSMKATIKDSSIAMNGIFNNLNFNSLLKFNFDEEKNGTVMFKVTSNIPRWISFSFEADIKMSDKPFTLSVTVNEEEVKRYYYVSLDYTKNSFDLEVKTPSNYLNYLKVNGNFRYQAHRFDTSILFNKNSEKINLTGFIDFNKQNPHIKVNIATPYSGMEELIFDFTGTFEMEKSINFLFRMGEQSYKFDIVVKLNKTIGSSSINIELPLQGLNNFNANLSYDTESRNKHARIEIERDGVKELLAIEVNFAYNEITVGIETPIENFRRLLLNSTYQKTKEGFTAQGKIISNDDVYRFEGTAEKRENGYVMQTSFPVSNYDTITLNGEIDTEKLQIKIIQGGVEKEILISYMFSSNKAFMKINSPFEDYKYFAIGGEFDVKRNAVNCNMYMHKNSERIEVDGTIDVSPPKTNLKLNFEAPSSLPGKYALQFFYDITSDKKGVVGLEIQNGQKITKYSVETLFNGIKRGYIKVQLPIREYEETGFEYKFESDDLKDTEVYITMIQGFKKLTFGIQSKIKENELVLLLNTPIYHYEKFGIESKLSFENKEGKAHIFLGDHVFAFETSLRPENFIFRIETPFDSFKILNLTSKYGLKTVKKFIELQFKFNDINYELNLNSQFSRSNPQFNFKINSPLEFLNIFEIATKFDMTNTLELLNITSNINSNEYHLSFGYLFENLKALLKLNIVSPIDGWTKVKFYTNIDLESNNKVLDISFESEGNSNSIFLSGNVYDKEINFDIQTPYEAIGNFKANGSLNRSKRSIELEMMNDMYSGGISANFNSLKINAKTPFKKAKKVHFDLSKNKKGNWSLNYERDGKKVFINLSLEHKKKGLTVKFTSKIPGWELLALTGRLDPEDVVAYLSGQRNSEMVSITVKNGLLGEKTGSVKIEMTSNFPNYKVVNAKLEYNKKRKEFLFDASSNSSNFKIHVQFKKNLDIDVFIPNEVQNTIAKGTLSVFTGNLDISSRFPALRTFKINYNVSLGPKIEMASTIIRNDVKIFDFHFTKDSKTDITHLMIHGKRGSNQSMLHYMKEGLKKFEFKFERNGKQLSIDLTGSGNLPMRGSLDLKIYNSFRNVPKTITGKIEIDRTSSPKQITTELKVNESKVYIITLKYNANLKSPEKGDFVLTTVTPDRSMAPWKNISGNWNLNRNRKGTVVLKVGPRTHTAKGQFGLLKNDVIVVSNIVNEKIYLQWNLKKQSNVRNYFFKIGRESKYVMFKLDGTFNTIFDGDVSGSFRCARFMPHDFNYTAKWSRSDKGLTGQGTFTFGQYSGTHHLINLKRNPEKGASKFNWEATSNIEGFNKISLIGEYSLADKLVDIKLSWDTDYIYIKGSLDNFKLKQSRNVINLHIPPFGDGQITLSHDFSNPLKRSIEIIGNVGPKKISYQINWTKNKDFTIFDFTADIKSLVLGHIQIKADFNVEDFKNSHGGFEYNRNSQKDFTIKWSTIRRKTSVKDKIMFTSKFFDFLNADIYLDADWKTDFIVKFGMKLKNKKLEGNLTVSPKVTTADVKKPFPRYRNVNLVIENEFGSAKTRKINFNYSLTLTNKNTGNLKITLATPYKALKTLDFSAKLENGKLDAQYKRNNVEVTFSGTAQVSTAKSLFDIEFVPPSGYHTKIKFDYDLQSFIKGGNVPKNIINANLVIRDQTINFNAEGFRNEEKINIDINGNTSLYSAKSFNIKLVKEINLNNMERAITVKVDDFDLYIKNNFEKRPQGFYTRSQIQSSMTSLPGITIGFGREDSSLIFTTGFGDEREISFLLKGKDEFRKGLSGTIDIPRRGIHNLDYTITYDFQGENKLKADLKIKVGEGQYIEADMLYNSDGVKSRLASPLLGMHNVRLRRSISDGHFMADVGVDNYGFTLEGDYNQNLFRKGFKLEGEIFGKKVLFDGFLNINSISDSEGKIIIQTPFKNLEKIRGHFNIKLSEERFYIEAETDLVYPISIKTDFDLVSGLKGDGILTIGQLVYEIKCNFMADEAESMKGYVIINTPHNSYERIVLDGTIHSMSFKHFQASLNAELPNNRFNSDISVKMDEPFYSIDLILRSNESSEFKILSEYSLTKYPFYLKGKSIFKLNRQTIFMSKSEVSFEGIKNMGIMYDANYKQNYITGTVNVQGTKEKVAVEFLGNIKNNHVLTFKANVPFHLNKINIDTVYEGKQKHTFSFELTKETSFRRIILKIELPSLIKINFESIIYKTPKFVFSSIIETPRRINKFKLHFDSASSDNEQTSTKFVTDMVIDLPYFDYPFSTTIGLMKSARANELTIKIGGHKISHVVYSKFERLEMLTTMQVKIESPFLSNEETNILLSYDFENKILCSLESYIFNSINNFYIDIRRENGLVLNCVSPLVPTGMTKIEAKVGLPSEKELDYKFTWADSLKTIYTEGKVKWNVDNESQLFMEIRTPFDNYRKINFGVNLIQGDVTRIGVFANPFNFKANSYFGVESMIFKTGIELQTGSEDNQLVKADAIVPLTKFAPSITAYFNEIDYEISVEMEEKDFENEFSLTTKNLNLPTFGLSYRWKAPYEINVEYQRLTMENKFKFGMMFDSSIYDSLRFHNLAFLL